MVMSSLRFCLFEKVLISFLFLKNSFTCSSNENIGTKYKVFLVDSFLFYFLSTLITSAHFLLSSEISNEKSADNLIKGSLYVLSPFSLDAFKILNFVFAF